jgi:hypothetical protein
VVLMEASWQVLVKNAWMGLKGVLGSLLLKQAGNGW